MFNSNKTKLYIVLSAVVLFSLSFGIGYMLMERNIHNDITDNNIEKKETLDVEIVGEENIIGPNTFIEMRTNYKECGHVESEVELADDSIVNMTRDEYEEYLNDNTNYRLLSFSDTKATIWGERNHLCPNHYVVGENDGNIAVFSIDEDGNRVLERVFEDYHINLLQELDREKIVNGIVVDSQEELSEVLENFIS